MYEKMPPFRTPYNNGNSAIFVQIKWTNIQRNMYVIVPARLIQKRTNVPGYFCLQSFKYLMCFSYVLIIWFILLCQSRTELQTHQNVVYTHYPNCFIASSSKWPQLCPVYSVERS